MGALQFRRYGIELGLGALDRHSRLQPSHHGECVAPAVGLRADREWLEEVDVRTGSKYRGEVERGRQDTNDHRSLVVEGDRASYNPRVAAEAPLPKTVGKNGGGLSVPDALIVDEPSTELGTDAEQAKEVL